MFSSDESVAAVMTINCSSSKQNLDGLGKPGESSERPRTEFGVIGSREDSDAKL